MARGRPSGDAARTAAETAPLSELGGATTEPHAGRTPAVEVVDVRRRFGAREALAGASFTVVQGELFGLLGPNGGGKSTLFRIIATLLRADGGTARILGHDVMAAPDEVRRRLGVVFQHPSVDGKLTVEENLRHHGRLYGLRGGELVRRRDDLVALTHLEPYLDRRAGQHDNL